jgi:hypothetical protein
MARDRLTTFVVSFGQRRPTDKLGNETMTVSPASTSLTTRHRYLHHIPHLSFLVYLKKQYPYFDPEIASGLPIGHCAGSLLSVGAGVTAAEK